MVTSLGLIFLAGLAAAALCQRLKLPRIIGMLAAGILLGPCALNLLDPAILSVSAELRQIALVIILLRAGLSLKLGDLKKVGRPALLMCFVPASFEILGFVLCAPAILGVTRLEAAVMGAVLGAVSPAVVVPRMVQLMESGYGTDKSIPQMILAGASCDDVFVIVLFSAFTRMAQGGRVRAEDFLQIPLSIGLGILLGAVAGWGMSLFFHLMEKKGRPIRSSVKVIVLLGTSFLLLAVESWLKAVVSLSGLLAVISMACSLRARSGETTAARLSGKLGRLWLAAELILFVLVGAAVDIRYTLAAGVPALEMILTALVFRSAGVALCLLKTPLNGKERCFCILAYLPKATVQAAIGSVPLTMGLACGPMVLSVAVLAILVTAPAGALGMDATYRRLLNGGSDRPAP